MSPKYYENPKASDFIFGIKSEKKKMEFSKKWLIAVIAISCVFTAASYILAWFDKNPVSEISVAVIQTLWGTSGVSFVSYAVQNSVRAFTSTKILGMEIGSNNDPNNIQPEDTNNAMYQQPTVTSEYNYGGQEDYDYR